MSKMTTLKPRGRPPSDGNCIVWTEPLVENLLRLRFETYSDPSARGSKLTRHSWPKVAAQLTELNNGDEVSVQQCRNKLKVIKKKWLAYHAGLSPEPMCVALMDAYWSGETHEAMMNESPRQSRPSPEYQTPAKKPRLSLTSPPSASLTTIAPAPAQVSLTPEPSASSASTAAPTQTTEVASPTSSTASPAVAGTGNVTDTSTHVMETSQGFTATATASAVAQPVESEDAHSGGNTDLSKLEKLIDDRFAKVLDRQDKQLRLAEEQNQLMALILAALQRREHP
ncbi:hypothetical protein P3T76_004080 [Phytophthora citrophthora]|uniref:Myb/SANT-like domain-containing protein n=1 Tax=Phytophthora citrophthora TaxID=4793 RepID=A0AAD9LNR2_9STRA|nr:hypothetical protein P3T76_004080 [Phytophthora citrophthora]